MAYSLLYIDPGTGSMLFTVAIGLASAGIYALRSALVKLRFIASGGRAEKDAAAHEIAIFSDGKQYWNVFEPICDELERRGTDALFLTASADDPALNRTYEHVKCEFAGEGNKAFARMNMLSASVVLSTTPGLDVYQWKRSRDAKWYAHVLHAASDVTMYRMFGLDFYDAVLLSGRFQEEQIRQLEALRNLPAKETALVGLTYMDALSKRLEEAAEGETEQAERADKDALEQPAGAAERASDTETNQPAGDAADSPADTPSAACVLVAPSWGASALFSLYGGAIIDGLLEAGYQVIVRPHPQSFKSEAELMERLMAAYPESETLEWDRDVDNFDVLRRADILISDFSGVIFDFALVFDKPVIYTEPAYDTAPYDACWLDEQPWTFSVLPRIGKQLSEGTATDAGKLQELVEECLDDTTLQAGRDRARRECWCNQGNAAEAVVDYLEAKVAKVAELAE
ncbi:MAG: CDP-glycerol glycerophosphotransferase family protein [Eggerthellaceae bacterium]|nr:CDP-glycerol glycerophosphotransferase family protein [Eggerthellaceae bacterium]